MVVWVVVKVDEPIERPVRAFRGQCGGGIIPYDPVSQLCSMAGHRCSPSHLWVLLDASEWTLEVTW